jgi:hypothetical protein
MISSFAASHYVIFSTLLLLNISAQHFLFRVASVLSICTDICLSGSNSAIFETCRRFDLQETRDGRPALSSTKRYRPTRAYIRTNDNRILSKNSGSAMHCMETCLICRVQSFPNSSLALSYDTKELS